ncbi:Sel1 repeat-containing protein [Aliarcobacter butzleri 7h1h]|uniref:tetratricopeptide repeat protein n=1 Tax=Aliarcobacter butzleri TaxID=28197 RepID=UPI00031DC19E|nr:tetratricopeptide repeat protein [Aliarcobacter butzleri]AGR78051.1 Sel1 repeat-containing protein [Aliarcobacter butzleri 7h1h]
MLRNLLLILGLIVTITLGSSLQQGYSVDYLEGNVAYSMRDYEKAFRLFEKSANQGEILAQAKLGEMYTNGIGTNQDFNKAFYWSQKYIVNQPMKAVITYADSNNYEKALEWLKSLANDENIEAQLTLASLYYLGNMVKQDYKKSIYWYEKAANQGNTNAYVNLIEIFDKQKDYKKSLFWHKKFSEHENYYTRTIAQQSIGKIYIERGESKRAIQFYEKLAKKGEIWAQDSLGEIYQKEMDLKKSFYWYEKAAGGGSLVAQYWLGYYYENGIINVGSLKKPIWTLIKINEMVNSAINITDNSYIFLKRDFKQAKKWYGKACDGGDQFSCDEYTKLNKIGY